MQRQPSQNSDQYRQKIKKDLQDLNQLITKIDQCLKVDDGHQFLETEQSDIMDYVKSKCLPKNCIKFHRKNKLSTVIEQSITQQQAISPRILNSEITQNLTNYNPKSIELADNISNYQINNPVSNRNCLKTDRIRSCQLRTPSLSRCKKIKGIKEVICTTPSSSLSRRRQISENKINQSQLHKFAQKKINSMKKRTAIIDVRALKKKQLVQTNNKIGHQLSKRGIIVLSNRKNLQNQESQTQQNQYDRIDGRQKNSQKQLKTQNHQRKRIKTRLGKTNIRQFFIEKRIYR